jgi:hypothetical protein
MQLTTVQSPSSIFVQNLSLLVAEFPDVTQPESTELNRDRDNVNFISSD